MKILFITIGQIRSLSQQNIFTDLINAVKEKGHEICVVATNEKRYRQKTKYIEEDGIKFLRVKIGNITKCSSVEKAISMLFLHSKFKSAIKKYFIKEQFDLVLYGAPPVTLAKTVKYCKNTFGCKSYLMLKDIFPQNSVDLGMLKKTGLKGIIYKKFEKIEKLLYKYSDKIGCMSQENINYILEHNSDIDKEKLEIFPNAVNFNRIKALDYENAGEIENCKNNMIFIYGGNLGKPQGLDFLVKGIKTCDEQGLAAHFVIIGSGTEKDKIFQELSGCKNATTYDELPQDKYLSLMNLGDVGMIMLDHRFTIPNYPSRTLSYMQNSKPVFACTDKVTDIRQLIEEQAVCGKWSYSDDISSFVENVQWFINNKNKLAELGRNGREYLYKYFNTDRCLALLENFINK